MLFLNKLKTTAMISRRDSLKNLAVLTGGTVLFSKQMAAEKFQTNQFSYCLNTSTISGQSIGFLKEFELCAKAGYDGIEIWIRDLQNYVNNGGNLKDLKNRIIDLGLTVENAIGFAQWIVDDESTRNAGVEQLKREMDLLAQINCKRIAAPPAGASGGSMIDLFKVAERYHKILSEGENLGVTPQLEFWGTSANLYHIAQAMFVATAAGHPKACILPDVYHMFRGGSSFESLKMISGNTIQMFHFNDFVAEIPREKQTDNDRVYPGDGIAPYKQIINDLISAGGEKVVSLELFNKNYWDKDAFEVACTGLQKMKALVENATKITTD